MDFSQRFIGLTTIAAVAMSAALFGGCVLFRPHVDDLTFVSLEPSRQARTTNRTMFDLHFTTSRDLLALDTYGAYVGASLCPFTRQPNVSFSTVRYHGRDLTDYRISGRQALTPSGNGPFEYDAVLYYEHQSQFNPERHTDDRFDLPANPQDLCFAAEGPSYLGSGGFDSNVAVIPKDALARALVSLKNAPR